MSLSQDPEEVTLIAKILTACVVALLSWMKFTSGKAKAEIAEAVLTERPVSHKELLECQIAVNTIITSEFKGLRTELMTEIKSIHERIDKIHIP